MSIFGESLPRPPSLTRTHTHTHTHHHHQSTSGMRSTLTKVTAVLTLTLDIDITSVVVVVFMCVALCVALCIVCVCLRQTCRNCRARLDCRKGYSIHPRRACRFHTNFCCKVALFRQCSCRRQSRSNPVVPPDFCTSNVTW